MAYVVPFLFAFSPTLLLLGPWQNVVLSVVTAIFGTVLLGVGLVGYLFRMLRPIRRALFIIAAIGLLVPIVDAGKHASLTWASNGVGLVLGFALLIWERLAHSRPRAHSVAIEADETSIGGPPRRTDSETF